MKNKNLFNPLRLAGALAFAFSSINVNAQWSPNWPGNIANWNIGGSGNSEPALLRPTPWALGGNSLTGMVGGPFVNQINNVANPLYRSASIGTVNDATFVMKANNKEAIFIDPNARVGLGMDNITPGNAPVDIWSSVNAPINRSRLSFYADKPGNIESSENMSLLFKTSSAFNVKEGSVSSGSTSRFTITGGMCGINNTAPTAALDVRSSTSPSNFRIFGDAGGNVHSNVDMKLNYGNAPGSTEFQINSGNLTNGVTRILVNLFGAHLHTDGSVFNGLFIGPSTSTWYNNTASHRLWIDAVNNEGLAIVGGNGHQALNIFNNGGAIRFGMLIGTGGNDDTKFDMRGSVQMGYFQSTNAWEDANTRLNVSALSNGIKVTTGSSTTKAFLIENPNVSGNTPNTFIVYGNGKTQIGPNYADLTGPASTAMLSVNGMILAKDIRVSISDGPGFHWKWADYVFEKDYKLSSLAEVEEYITKNKHLPNVPSEAEVKRDGISLAELDITLLQKVEELFLYTIELNKQNEKLQLQIEKLSKEVKDLSK
jgi:hypothetical protein